MTIATVRDIPKDQRDATLKGYRAYRPRPDGKRDQIVLVYSYIHDGDKWWNVAGWASATEESYREDVKESELTMPVIA